MRRLWLGQLPIAHAFTIYIAAHLASSTKYSALSRDKLLRKGWEAQLTGVPSLLMDVEVDKDCLAQLEEEMFEVSKRAGIAGYYQWGFDSGDHQYWWPYADLPEHWNHGDYDENETQLVVMSSLLIYPFKDVTDVRLINQRGEYYLENTPLPELETKIPPKPRPIHRKG